MAYLLLAVTAVIALFGIAKISHAQLRHGIPWATLLVWAVLFVGSLSIWLLSVRIH